MIDHTVHVIDLLRWFFDAEVSEVYAEIGVGLLHDGLDIDDAGMLSFTLSNGTYGTLDTSWSRPSAFPTRGDCDDRGGGRARLGAARRLQTAAGGV